MDDLERWTRTVSDALGLPTEAVGSGERSALLDLARVAAHGVDRPAAPLTTFLVGLAIGRAQASGDDLPLAAAAATVTALADAWGSG